MRERFPRQQEPRQQEPRHLDARHLDQGGDRAAVATPVPYPTDFGGGGARDAETMGLLQEYFQTVRRYKWTLLGCALVGLAASLLFGMRTLPVYRTRTSLDIRPLNADFMNIRSVNPTSNEGGAEGDTNLQTQIKLLESETALGATMNQLREEPHPAAVPREDLLSQLQRTLHLGHPAPIPYDQAVREAAKGVRVKPLGVTRLVEITCDAWSAELAARFCNELESTFQENDLQARSAEAAKTSAWLTKQVADVRQRAVDTQNRLEVAVGGNGLALNPNNNVGEDRLRALQDELVKAQADRISKEAESGMDRTAAPGTAPEVLDSPAHRAYESQLADLRGQLAKLAPSLTDENPKVKVLRSQIKAAEDGMRQADETSLARQNNELSSARHREALLNLTYSAELAKVSSDLQRTAKVSLLRSELDSEQQLYQTLLQRAKEAGFASAMQAATIRVVDPARVPEMPFSPQRTLAAGVGLFLGGLFGTAFAFYRERTLNVFRKPGDVQRFLHVHELGTIPALAEMGGAQKPSPMVLSGMPGPARGLLPGTTETTALSHWKDEFSLAAEAYRNTTLSILISEARKGSRTYVVASPNAGEGKTTVTSNLGVALSQSKMKVVLVDGDLRKPNLHNAFAMENRVGLRNVLRGEFDLKNTPLSAFTRATELPNVSVISAGHGDEELMELLHSPALPQLLDRLSASFDMVLIDTPPTLHMADTRILAREADGVILVFRASTTTLDAAAMARDLFDRDGIPLVGTILNDFNPQREGWGSYYKGYYRYQRKGDSRKAATAA